MLPTCSETRFIAWRGTREAAAEELQPMSSCVISARRIVTAALGLSGDKCRYPLSSIATGSRWVRYLGGGNQPRLELNTLFLSIPQVPALIKLSTGFLQMGLY